MKIMTGLLLILLSLFNLPSYANISIFSCEPEWAALAEELGGEKVSAFSATTGLQDPHHIEARPSLIAKVRNADMIACTGAELEAGWLPLLLQRASNPNLNPPKPGYFMATEQVRLLGIPSRIDRGQGDVHASGNPHIQTNPANILLVARAMSARLIELDPANSDHYQLRFDDFETRWKAALKRWKRLAAPLENMTVVVHHNSWAYLADWLKLEQLATLEEKPGIPPSSGHLANILHQMKSRPAKVIIHSAYQSDKPSKWLSQKTGIPAIALASTIGGNEQAKDLFSLFDDIINRLLQVTKP